MQSEPSPAYAGRRAPGRRPGAGPWGAALQVLLVGAGAGSWGAALLAGAAFLAGCAGNPAPRPLPAGDVQPWQIPPGAYGSQRLYRASYSGPQGEGNFRLTLRLASAERYQVTSSDPLGRALWSLDVLYGDGAERGLWLDHRNKAYCEFTGRFDVVGVPLAPFPLLSLPALLLGRLPAAPADDPETKGR